MNMILGLLPALLLTATPTATSSPAVGTSETVGKVDNLEIVVKVNSPSAEATPLQIVCLFEYTEGDIFKSPPALPKALNGLVHVDQALKGIVTEFRKSEQFKGKALETLLIKPPENSISADRLLLIGLGNRNDFKPEMMRLVGLIGMREALRLGVTRYAHASDLKDAGYTSPTAAVAGYVVQGAIEAYRTQKALQKQNASDPLTVTQVTLLAGPAYFEDSIKGIKQVITEQP